MQRYPFIFSDTRSYRLKRHATFWACWWAFQSILYAFVSMTSQVPYIKRLPMSAIEALFYLVPHMFLAYMLMYVVVPRLLLKGRYLATVASVLGLFVATAAISATISIVVLNEVRALVFGKLYVPPKHINQINFFLSLLAGLRGAITIGGLAAAIKLMKYWYVKEQTNLQLQQENTAAQLQLLKAQVHPHFLFNTLNNIYAHTQATAPQASQMVVGLSDMLRYMLYECNQPLVPLQKEVKMVTDYVRLEQVRYGNQIDLNIDLPEATGDLQIAPLLLLPFVENSFKHGASRMLEQPWISLQVTLDGAWLKMKLLNGKPAGTTTEGDCGIGIQNVIKRLQLLYPNRHQLSISNDDEVFIVNLKLQLERTPASGTTVTILTNEPAHARS